MAEISINPISAVRAAETSGVLARAPTAQTESTAVPAAAAKQPVAPVQDNLAAAKLAPIQEKAPAAKPVESTTASAPLVGNASNVALQFRVDAKTKDVTVFVVDRSSKKVLRSIPASELAKLSSGDLVSLTR